MNLLFGFIQLVYTLFLTILILTLTGLTWLSFKSPSNWILAMAPYFVIQYAILGFVLLIITLLQKKSLFKWLQVGLLTALLAVNLFRVLPYYLPTDRPATEKRLKIMSANAFGKINKDVAPTVAAIRKEKPDVIGFTEYTVEWQTDFKNSGVLKDYPYRAEGKSHIAIYSKFPIKRVQYFYNKAELANDVTLAVELDVHGKRVTLWNSHPPVPFGRYFERQKSHYDQWSQKIPNTKTPFVLIGDFNTTPWSPNYQNLLTKTGLKDTQYGFGIQPTWPAYASPIIVNQSGLKAEWLAPFISLFAIPIDHVLVSKEFMVLDRYNGPAIGSDHFPVIVELGLRE